MLILFVLSYSICKGQTQLINDEDTLIRKILAEPSPQEIRDVLNGLRNLDLSPKEVVIHDSTLLSNSNILYILSHRVEGHTHFGAVIIPANSGEKKLPLIVFATGGDGIHKEFDISQDFNHAAAQFPSFLGKEFDGKFIVVIPSFRGQQLILGEKKFQSEGEVSDAFGGATTDALALINATLNTFRQADESRIATYGGSRGGTVALLAAARDSRIKRAIAVAAPTDMKALYQLYPDQFRLLFFNELLAGKISEEEARKKFISISPVYFVDELPLVQLHHDKNDPFVPADFAKTLTDTMTTRGKRIETYFYDEGIHGFWSDSNFWDRVQEFIGQLSK